jgi:hypothetical protein
MAFWHVLCSTFYRFYSYLPAAVFDALMILLAMITLNVLHPGILLVPEMESQSLGSTTNLKRSEYEMTQTP